MGNMFVDRIVLQLELNNEQVKQGFKDTENRLKSLNQRFKQVNRGLLGFGLSALFTGMAMKRLGEQILNSLVKTYIQATDEQNVFNQQLLAVQASFEFLKFSIMDALGTSDMVIGFIEFMIELVNWVSEFVNKHPLIAKIIGAFLIFLIVVGAILMVVGQVTLGILGIISLGELIAPLIEGITLSGFLYSLTMILVTIGAIIAIGYLLYNLFTTDMTKANPVLTAIKVILLLIALAVLFIISPLLGLIALFVAIGLVIWKLYDDFGSFGNFFKAVLRGLIMALGFIGEAIFEFMIAPFKIVAAGLLGIVKIYDLLLGKTTSTKFLEDFIKATPILTGAAVLADKIKFDETTGDLFTKNAGINGTANPLVTNNPYNLSGSVGKINPQGMSVRDDSPQNVNINIENMLGNDATMIELMDKYVKQSLQNTNNRYNGVPTGG